MLSPHAKMSEPYYKDDLVTLYHGDCLTVAEWLDADVLVTDPPYGRAWRQGEVNEARGLKPSAHSGIANDETTDVRDMALSAWGEAKPAVAFGDLMLSPPAGTRHVLIYDKGTAVGFHGAVGGYRRNAEAVYLIGPGHGSGLGGRSAIITTSVGHPGSLSKETGHPHTKPADVMTLLIGGTSGTVADPFAGSGSTLLAARNLGRQSIGVELEERYCELIAKRLSQQAFDFGSIEEIRSAGWASPELAI